MDRKMFNSEDYEQRYRQGYGLCYPESHIIRIHRHILEWELQMTSGTILDFGCGAGAHLKYFTEHSFTPYGCDTSDTAIERCKQAMPEYAANFMVTAVEPDLPATFPGVELDVFLSNQVLYYLEDRSIREIAGQAHRMLKNRGIFIATMMDYDCWYARYKVGRTGDFTEIFLDTPRVKEKTLVNLKHREDLEPLFAPFRKLHIGSYGPHVREEEGPTKHWIFVGIRD